MREEEGADTAESGESAETDQERRTRRERLAEAIHGLRESIEETIAEARERGDVSAEKAREMLRAATDRAVNATSEARERFDFVTRADFDELVERVAALEARLAARIGGTPQGEDAAGEERADPE